MFGFKITNVKDWIEANEIYNVYILLKRCLANEKNGVDSYYQIQSLIMDNIVASTCQVES